MYYCGAYIDCPFTLSRAEFCLFMPSRVGMSSVCPLSGRRLPESGEMSSVLQLPVSGIGIGRAGLAGLAGHSRRFFVCFSSSFLSSSSSSSSSPRE